MKGFLFVPLFFISILLFTNLKSEPGFNGTSLGCGGSGCHSSQSGIITTEILDNFQVRITVTGTSSKVGGELINETGSVVAVNNSTSSNPFILTAPGAGTYTVNAGFKNPSLKWESTSVVVSVTEVDEELFGSIPKRFELYTNYPNPFNPSTIIRYAISQSGFTKLKVYSILGQEVATLVNEYKTSGIYEVNFNALNLTSGTYLYKLTSGDFTETRKMIVVK